MVTITTHIMAHVLEILIQVFQFETPSYIYIYFLLDLIAVNHSPPSACQHVTEPLSHGKKV